MSIDGIQEPSNLPSTSLTSSLSGVSLSQTQAHKFLSVCSSSHPVLTHVNLQLTMGAVCVCVCVCVDLTVSIFVLFKILLTWLFDQHTVTVSQPYFRLQGSCVHIPLPMSSNKNKNHSDLDETVDTDLRFNKYMADWRETEKTREGENVCVIHWVQKPVRQDLTSI